MWGKKKGPQVDNTDDVKEAVDLVDGQSIEARHEASIAKGKGQVARWDRFTWVIGFLLVCSIVAAFVCGFLIAKPALAAAIELCLGSLGILIGGATQAFVAAKRSDIHLNPLWTVPGSPDIEARMSLWVLQIGGWIAIVIGSAITLAGAILTATLVP